MAYGLRTANTAGAGYHTGGFVEYKIGTLGTAIFNGSCVTMVPGLGIAVLAVPIGTTANTAGVLVGARWTNSEGEIKFGQSYDGASTNTDAYAFVALASDTIFRIQGTAGFVENQRGTARPFTAGTPLTGSAITGNSNLTCDNDGTIAAAAPFIVIDVVNDGKQASSATPDLLVRFSSGAIQNLIG